MLERKIVGVCWGPGQPATALVLTDESGRILGSPLFCPSLSGPTRRSRQPDQLQYNPLEDPQKVRLLALLHMQAQLRRLQLQVWLALACVTADCAPS